MRPKEHHAIKVVQTINEKQTEYPQEIKLINEENSKY